MRYQVEDIKVCSHNLLMYVMKPEIASTDFLWRVKGIEPWSE